MRILYLTTHLNIGGITSYVLSLAGGLKRRGHTVYVASSGGEVLDRFTEGGIEFISIPIKTKSEASPRVLVSAFKLRKCIREYDIDILHANTRVTQVLSHILSHSTRTPYVVTCHGFFKKKLHRQIFPCWGARTIAISEPVKKHLMHDFGVAESAIRLIHHGIDSSRVCTEASADKEKLKISMGLGKGPVIGIIARLSDVKGHIHLIHAMQGVRAALPDAQLLIIGEGKMERELLSLTERLNLSKHVIFIPKAADMREALSVIDVFAMPSLHEGLGLGLMEAMSCAMAVVGSNVGGIKSLIRHNETGMLVPAANPQKLAEALIALLHDAPKRKNLGENARKFIHEHFSFDEMVRKTEEVYKECISGKK